MGKTGFDCDKYARIQSEKIAERIDRFGGKLYLEFGGKLFDDYHASRVLPGFEPDSKMKMLLSLADKAEIVLVISADDVETKIRRDLGITYDADVLRLIDSFTSVGLYVGSVVITRFAGQPGAVKFRSRLSEAGIASYLHYPIEGYPYDLGMIFSADGFEKNDYIETKRPLVVVTAPGPGSGKLATCLSQLWHENKRGIKAGYAKFETFPIWNLPLKHPVNLAYEAATADLSDVNMIDPYHLEAYGETTVNYNRDVEAFPVLNTMFERIYGESPYKSPTDMGVNMAGYCISDDAVCREAGNQEIVRRWYAAQCDSHSGIRNAGVITKLSALITQAGIDLETARPCVKAALDKSEATGGRPAFCIELPDGRLVCGKTSPLLGSASAALLNSLKTLAGIPDEVTLISPDVLEPIGRLKTEILGHSSPLLHTQEVLIALTLSASRDANAAKALDAIGGLEGSEAHSTVILASQDSSTLRNLGINLTCEAKHERKKLFRA
ncbi:MAG: DUF1846 domain-containing protein [Clostridia bacterium]|nr:DUF1846 domain-containing protein [Clostridia bacterium]